MKWLAVSTAILCVASSVTAGELKSYSNRDLEKYMDKQSKTDTSGSYVGSPMSVDFKKADLIMVLKLISDSAMADGAKVYIDPYIRGKITIKRVNTPWRKVLIDIAEEHNLDLRVDRSLKQIYVSRSPGGGKKLPGNSSSEGDSARPASFGVQRNMRLICESGHWIESVSDDGGMIKLEDGSLWEVDPVDAFDSALWLPLSGVVACDDRIINVDDNETVSVTRTR